MKQQTFISPKFEKATFAGGCFWCLQQLFDEVEGVKATTVGYTGGESENPTYEEVCSGTTGHAEAIQIDYDPSVVSYSKLLEIFWRNIDPVAKNRQFSDQGTQYRTAIFYYTDQQRQLAEASKKALKFQKIQTEILPATEFYPAEDYHQTYYKKNAYHYTCYKNACGRKERLEELWGSNKRNNPMKSKNWGAYFVLLIVAILLFLFFFMPEVFNRIMYYSGPGSPFVRTPGG